MSDETNDHTVDLSDPSEYDDIVSQRAIAFCHLAKVADSVRDELVREQCLIMLRKLNASIRAPSTAEVRSIDGGQA
ncbi:hypothetical protein [Methylosinus sp. Ce-a6]|uniref:hypothetical protein n=1 Tax=Methylosinus sp. Ce-a6 TaxID=2172005 RepID=UPI0013582EC3|nr:hypothetical protein [Methylosinus sp. Ce-a6]